MLQFRNMFINTLYLCYMSSSSHACLASQLWASASRLRASALSSRSLQTKSQNQFQVRWHARTTCIIVLRIPNVAIITRNKVVHFCCKASFAPNQTYPVGPDPISHLAVLGPDGLHICVSNPMQVGGGHRRLLKFLFLQPHLGTKCTTSPTKNIHRRFLFRRDHRVDSPNHGYYLESINDMDQSCSHNYPNTISTSTTPIASHNHHRMVTTSSTNHLKNLPITYKNKQTCLGTITYEMWLHVGSYSRFSIEAKCCWCKPTASS